MLRTRIVAALVGSSLIANVAAAQSVDPAAFRKPAAEYRPTLSIDEGSGWSAPVPDAARRVIGSLAAGGVLINPQGDPSRDKKLDMVGLAKLPLGLLDSYPPYATPWLPKALPGEARFGSYMADGRAGPGNAPRLGYMTPAWFAAMRQVLTDARQSGVEATYYDEAGFPSGSANYTIPAKYYRKLLRRDVTNVAGGQPYAGQWPADQTPVAVVAFNTATKERLDLTPLAKDGKLSWTAPYGNWEVQRFTIVAASAKATSPDYHGTADYLDPEATRWFIANSYQRAYDGLREFFGTTIKYTFFDDVGIFMDEKTWNPAVAARFEKLTGKPATLYYPALWTDIGPETAAARVAFFRARAELLGETFPKLITEWDHAHGVKSTGHAPGNYDLQPTDTNGDPFKFYAYSDVPMADAVWGVGFARGGYKLISSVSAQRDLPQTAVEGFSVDNDANGYRRLIEFFTRGFNRFYIGGRVPSKPVGTAPELMDWAGRSSYLLRGGRHVADIAIVFPIESLQAFYSFNAPLNSQDLPSGAYAYRDADYQAVGEMLMSALHRDFTFVHPDALGSGKLNVVGRTLEMANPINREQYRAVILPGGDVVSVAALRKIKAFWDAGGTVVATSLLPSRSAEFGKDADVRGIVAAMFGDKPGQAITSNAAGGKAMFVANPSPAALRAAFDALKLTPDVGFAGDPAPTSDNGVFGYIHRQRGGRDIYYFGNSSGTAIDTTVTLRGRLQNLSFWNPATGQVSTVPGVQYRTRDDGVVTEFRLAVPALSSMAVVGTAARSSGSR